MNLPQELLDEILSHIHPHDTVSLKSCSLVSKSWAEPSRRILFATVYIRPHTELWKGAISPSNPLLRHTRSLEYLFLKNSHIPPYLPSFHTLRDYLLSFTRLRTLKLCCIIIQPTISDNLELLSAFKHTLVSLTLSSVLAAWSSFVLFVGHFPNLRDLTVYFSSLEVDDLPIPTTTHAGRGSLCVGLFPEDADVFCDRFTELKPEYNELRLFGRYEHRFLAAVERNLQSLTLDRCNSENTPGLSRCPNLRQLLYTTTEPLEGERGLISSITSTNFRKLVFKVRLIGGSHLDDPCWTPLDSVLCGLVDRLQKSGSKNTLEVELQADCVELKADACLEREEFLSKFREKGRVSVVELTTGRRWGWGLESCVSENLEVSI